MTAPRAPPSPAENREPDFCKRHKRNRRAAAIPDHGSAVVAGGRRRPGREEPPKRAASHRGAGIRASTHGCPKRLMVRTASAVPGESIHRNLRESVQLLYFNSVHESAGLHLLQHIYIIFEG